MTCLLSCSSLLVQWDLPPLYFFPGGRLGPVCYPHVKLDNVHKSRIKHSSHQVFVDWSNATVGGTLSTDLKTPIDPVANV